MFRELIKRWRFIIGTKFEVRVRVLWFSSLLFIVEIANDG